MSMCYEIGDLIVYRSSDLLVEGKIEYIEQHQHFTNYKYRVRNLNEVNENSVVWIREDDIENFSSNSNKYMQQEVNKLLENFKVDDIVNALYNIINNQNA